MSTLSDLFYQRTQKHYLTNITHISNIPSILTNGILCYDSAKSINHVSVAIENVQDRRRRKRVPNGLPLHQYTNLYFAPRNTMMYYLKCNMAQDQYEDLIVLMVDPCVLDIDGTVVTDGNAASAVTRFFPPDEGLKYLDFEKVYAEWWNDSDPYVKAEKERIKCSEVLVPYGIPSGMIIGALVQTERTKEKLISQGFTHRITIYPKTFFL